MTPVLTPESIQFLIETNANQASTGYNPIVQCVQVKPVQNNGSRANNSNDPDSQARRRFRVSALLAFIM